VGSLVSAADWAIGQPPCLQGTAAVANRRAGCQPAAQFVVRNAAGAGESFDPGVELEVTFVIAEATGAVVHGTPTRGRRRGRGYNDARMGRTLAAAPLFLPVLLADADFAGSRACASCHRSQYERQSQSHHALSLRSILQTRLPALPGKRPVAERGGIEYSYQVQQNGLLVTAASRGSAVSGLPQRAFGAGAQGFTPVGRLPLGFFEHRISWYTERGAPGVTFGESGRDSGVQDSHQQLLGRVCTNSLRGSVFEFLQPYAETPGGVEPRACLFSINDQ